MRKAGLFTLSAAAVLLAPSLTARAAVIPALVSVITTATRTTFTYDLSLTSDEEITGANSVFSTFYDPVGYIAGSAMVVTGPFTAGEQFVGPNGFGTAPTDSPTALNPTFLYTGGPVAAPVTSLTLGTVSFATAPSTPTQFILYTGQANKATGGAAGTITGNIGFVLGPGSTQGVPEPGSIAMLTGMGIASLGFVARRRRK